MSKLDRYLLSDFIQSFLATLLVLLVVSVGGVLVDLLGRIADGQIPAGLLLGQLGLQFIVYLPLIVPMALMLGLALAIGRLYRDSEMAVLTAVGIGPRRLLRPVLMLVLPVVMLVGTCSLWLGPWAQRTAQTQLEEANRSVLMAGLEPGKFTELSGGGVVYVSSLSDDGTSLGQVFVHRPKDGRFDAVSARSGRMYFEGERSRFLRLEDGFQVEGGVVGDLDYRLMRFAANEIALPDRERTLKPDDPAMQGTLQLLGKGDQASVAQLHSRLAPPLLALAFALMAVPLSRSAPRQQRYGKVMLSVLAYLFGVNLMIVGTQWLAKGSVPAFVGLWWLTLPLLGLGVWMYLRDGHLGRTKGKA